MAGQVPRVLVRPQAPLVVQAQVLWRVEQM